MILAFEDAVDIGHGRGRLAADAAASLLRVDAAFGRPADVNEAWRSPEQANANYARYLRYLNGTGPWAPIALPADQSVHCEGNAVDTDDTRPDQMTIWNDNGWYWTVYRGGELKERWHLERFPSRDNHRNTPATAGTEPLTPKDWYDMDPTELQKLMTAAFLDALRQNAREEANKTVTYSVPDGAGGQVYWAVDFDNNTKARLWNGEQLDIRRALGFREVLNQPPQSLDGFTDISVQP